AAASITASSEKRQVFAFTMTRQSRCNIFAKTTADGWYTSAPTCTMATVVKPLFMETQTFVLCPSTKPVVTYFLEPVIAMNVESNTAAAIHLTYRLMLLQMMNRFYTFMTPLSVIFVNFSNPISSSRKMVPTLIHTIR